MHIAMVSLQFEETSTGGGGVHVEKICEQFLKSGHSVTLVSIHTERTLGRAKLEEGDVPLSIQRRGRLTVVRFLIDENISQPYVGEKDVELDRIERFARAAIEWLKKREEKFDIIHLHGHHIIPGLMARELQGTGTKIVSTVHSLESTFIAQSGESLGSFNATEEILIKLRKWEGLSRFADLIVLNSPAVGDDFKEILRGQDIDVEKFAGRIRLISSGCNEDFLMGNEEIKQKLSRVPKTIRLVTFCRIDLSKGIEFSINGAKVAAGLCPRNLYLTIAGIPSSDEYLNKVRGALENVPANLQTELKVFRAISSAEEKKALLDPMHIYILPTLKEPFGMSLIEASARGNMIVSTDSTGPRFMMAAEGDRSFDWGSVTQYGILTDITEDHHKNLADNMGKAIVWTIDNWHACKKKVLKFNKRIREKWTWEGIARQYLELFMSR